ncbi:MAG: Spy/CpxP family protein refolding chaperone [Thermoanaerobaculia bacterium]
MTSPEETIRRGSSWLKPGLLMLGTGFLLAAGFGAARVARAGLDHHMHGGGAEAHDLIELRITRELDKVGATASQKQQIKAIVDAGFARHKALAAEHEQLHSQLLAAVSGDTVDRAAIEVTRATALARIDQGSRELAQSLGDIAEVLTPSQRAKLALHHAKSSESRDRP